MTTEAKNEIRETKLDGPLSSSITMPSGDQAPESSKPVDDSDYNFVGLKTRFDPLSVVFALLLLIGGLIAYHAKASLMSLVVSFVAAALIGVGTYIDASKKTVIPKLIVTTLLVGGFAHRYYKKDFKFYPSGAFLVICTLMLVRYSFVHYIRSKKN